MCIRDSDITNVGKHERIHFGHLDTVTHIAQRRHAETEAEPFGQRNLHTDIPDIKSVIAGLRIGRLRIDIVHLATEDVYKRQIQACKEVENE